MSVIRTSSRIVRLRASTETLTPDEPPLKKLKKKGEDESEEKPIKREPKEFLSEILSAEEFETLAMRISDAAFKNVLSVKGLEK